jgi:hypothetical protein
MRRIIATAIVGVVIVLLVVAQLVLPGLAAQQLRDRLDGHGTVLSVEVSAFPAIKLLWHRADRVAVRMANYRSGTGGLGSELDQTADTGSLTASIATLDTGLVTLHDVTLTKRGNQLTGSGRVTEADLRTSVPFLEDVHPIASGDGRLTLRGTAKILGLSATIDATVAAQNGDLVVAPDVPLGALATVTVFSDPHVYVEDVSATSTADGFAVTAHARLH